MMVLSRLAFFLLLSTVPSIAGEALWKHLAGGDRDLECRGMAPLWARDRSRVQLTVAHGPEVERGVTWASVPAPETGWALSEAAGVEAVVRNIGAKAAKVTLWVVGSNGWGAVGDAARVDPLQSTTLRCLLRQTYPDGTPKLDPDRVAEVRIMVHGAEGAVLEVSQLKAVGTARRWVRPAGRLDVPAMTAGDPGPGRRVRYSTNDEGVAGVYSALYLPVDWAPGKRFPVIAELPGNLFFSADACWSTGRPEECVMGYGISKGRGAIWVSLPFVDRARGRVAEFGYGSRAGLDTVAYTRAVIEDLCANWGGDPDNVILSGFSRGAIACGYIGLRDEEIAGLWKGFVACQHYDGSWGTTMEGAVERAPRFRGQAIFQVDNERARYQGLVEVTDPSVKWTWGDSGLNYHATAMFLDERRVMTEMRAWFAALVEN